jgi:hypothetical protein
MIDHSTYERASARARRLCTRARNLRHRVTHTYNTAQQLCAPRAPGPKVYDKVSDHRYAAPWKRIEGLLLLAEAQFLLSSGASCHSVEHAL